MYGYENKNTRDKKSTAFLLVLKIHFFGPACAQVYALCICVLRHLAFWYFSWGFCWLWLLCWRLLLIHPAHSICQLLEKLFNVTSRLSWHLHVNKPHLTKLFLGRLAHILLCIWLQIGLISYKIESKYTHNEDQRLLTSHLTHIINPPSDIIERVRIFIWQKITHQVKNDNSRTAVLDVRRYQRVKPLLSSCVP